MEQWIKKFSPVVLAASLAACGGGGSSEPEQVTEAPAPVVCTVDLYGDSIMAGTLLPESPAAMLKRIRPAYAVNDYAISGEQAVQRAEKFDGGNSRFVVIEHGVNDAGLGLPYEPALRKMVQMAKAEGRTVIVTGLSQHTSPLNWVTAANEAARNVAASEGVTFADWMTVPFGGEAEMRDHTHPGSIYTERLVMRLVERLDQLAPECA